MVWFCQSNCLGVVEIAIVVTWLCGFVLLGLFVEGWMEIFTLFGVLLFRAVLGIGGVVVGMDLFTQMRFKKCELKAL